MTNKIAFDKVTTPAYVVDMRLLEKKSTDSKPCAERDRL